MREIDQVRVPGRNQPVSLYEILDYHDEESFPGMAMALVAFQEGLALYRDRK